LHGELEGQHCAGFWCMGIRGALDTILRSEQRWEFVGGHSPKLRREVRFVRDVEYWHWLLVEAQPEIVTFCEEPVPTHRYDAKLPALADVWLRRTDGSIEFRSIARSERQISSTARLS
jgi:hypothetical protein